jgi:hypothetical protein
MQKGTEQTLADGRHTADRDNTPTATNRADQMPEKGRPKGQTSDVRIDAAIIQY